MKEAIMQSVRLSLMDKDQRNLSFWMACPIFIILGQNIALFFLLLLLFHHSKAIKIFSNYHWIKIICFCFTIASALSVMFNNTGDYVKSLAVLPNYIYWQFLVVMLISLGKRLNFEILGKGIFIGISVYAFYYAFLYWIQTPLIRARITPNTYAFHIICFAAPALAYCQKKYGRWVALIMLLTLVGQLVFLGRRSGSVFTFLTGIATLYLPKIQVKYLVFNLFIALVFTLLLSTQVVENFILEANPRIHELLYETEQVQEEDRSYLTRRLMVEKGLLIFADHPITGIGLNSFGDYDVEFKGDFTGSEFVISKDFVNDISAHNSYINILSEGGVLLFVPFIILLFFNIIHFVKRYNAISNIQKGLYWGFIGACLSMYFVSGILNVNTWFLIGLVTAVSCLKLKKSIS